MSSRTRVAVFLNVSAGMLEGQCSDTLRAALTAAFEQHRVSATLEFLTGPELHKASQHAAHRIKDQELDAIVVGGGDGSIRTVADVLSGTNIPLGILPFGTLNHFARDLGIPTTIDEAVALIAAGQTRLLDVGEVNGETFINNSSIGLYPYLVRERERRRRREGLSKLSALIMSGFRVLRHLPLRRLSIAAEGLVQPCRSPIVFIGNNEYALTASVFGRRGRLDSGELCIYITRAQSRLALLWLAARAVVGRLELKRDLRIMRVSRAEIRSRASRLLVALDGEVVVLRSPLCYRSRPGALRVFGAPTQEDNE
ncbi:diacylglycerol kinase family protein [Microvirga sp. KLBC 81]|uniref:diacylglycerol/lipid kinase family protein n=1 Tax=Microvirga sp. KLBC 81 TaxID=1862707 RepID=UPI001403E106|nr:diacylglycerol kinase family protein [Microvirga sp. KLBC 81]